MPPVRAPISYDFSRECGKTVMPADVGQVCAQRHGNGIALAALLAAAIAGVLLFVQITQTERHEAERLRKTHLGPRYRYRAHRHQSSWF